MASFGGWRWVGPAVPSSSGGGVSSYPSAVHEQLGSVSRGSFVLFKQAAGMRGAAEAGEVACVLDLYAVAGSARMRVAWTFHSAETALARRHDGGGLPGAHAHERYLSGRVGRYELSEIARVVTATGDCREYRALLNALAERDSGGGGGGGGGGDGGGGGRGASGASDDEMMPAEVQAVAAAAVTGRRKRREPGGTPAAAATAAASPGSSREMRLLAAGAPTRFSPAHGYSFLEGVVLIRFYYDDRLHLLLDERAACRLVGASAQRLFDAVRDCGGAAAPPGPPSPPRLLSPPPPPPPLDAASAAVADAGGSGLATQRARQLLERAWQSLQLSVVCSPLPCREQERVTLTEHIAPKIAEGSSGVFYICGPPGTGKTALMTEVVRNLHARVGGGSGGSDGGGGGGGPLAQLAVPAAAAAATPEALAAPLPLFRSSYINALALTAGEYVYSALAHVVGAGGAAGGGIGGGIGADVAVDSYMAPTAAAAALEAHFGSGGGDDGGGGSPRPVHVVIIDEVDGLLACSSANQIVYNLFNWAQQPRARFVLICIGNTDSLPDKLEPKVASRVAQARVVLRGYNSRGLAEIARVRLVAAGLVPEGPPPPQGAAGAVAAAPSPPSGTAAAAAAGDLPIFEDGALRLAAARQSGEAGDVRRSMNALQVAVGIALRRLETSPHAGAVTTGLVTCSDVREARASLDRRALSYATPWQRLLLIAAAVVQSSTSAMTRSYQFTLDELHERLVALLVATGVAHLPMHTAYGGSDPPTTPEADEGDSAVELPWALQRDPDEDLPSLELATARLLANTASATAATRGIVESAAPTGARRTAVWGAGAADPLFQPPVFAGMYAHVMTLEQLAGVAEGLRLAGMVLLEPHRDFRYPLLRLRVSVDDIRECYGTDRRDPLASKVLS